jgi:hypothetical protein
MRAKYGVLDCDFYNFDETGFMMGIICPGMVVKRSDRRDRGKAVQPGNREWATAIVCVKVGAKVYYHFWLYRGLITLQIGISRAGYRTTGL